MSKAIEKLKDVADHLKDYDHPSCSGCLSCVEQAIAILEEQERITIMNIPTLRQAIEQARKQEHFGMLKIDQEYLQILLKKSGLLDQAEAKIKDYEKLYSAATKALNTQIEINSRIQAKIKELEKKIERLKEGLQNIKTNEGF